MPITSSRLAVTAAGAVLLAALAACSPTAGSKQNPGAAPPASTGAVAIPVGAGPQATYTAAAQPAPGSCHFRYTADKQPLPDQACTPGATSPAVTQANLSSTICKTGGYTSGIRPPVNITGKEKAENAKSYGYTGPMGDAEYDHLISLQLGGDPNDPRNLWIQPPSPDHVPGKGPNNPKDPVETRLHTAICKGQVTLVAAQQAIVTDWTTAEAKLGLKPDGSASAAVDPDDSSN